MGVLTTTSTRQKRQSMRRTAPLRSSQVMAAAMGPPVTAPPPAMAPKPDERRREPKAVATASLTPPKVLRAYLGARPETEHDDIITATRSVVGPVRSARALPRIGKALLAHKILATGINPYASRLPVIAPGPTGTGQTTLTTATATHTHTPYGWRPTANVGTRAQAAV
jgi:hypothetical protein